MNLVSSTVCSLPEYPNKKNTPGPAIFQYLEDQQVLAACGASDELTVGLTCYQLKAGSPSDWQQMPSSPLNPHCPWPYRTRSHYLNDLGWFVIGQDGSCSYSNADISTDLFTLDQQWIPTSTVSPYKPGFPGGMCSVAINSTHIIFTGGYNGNWLSSTLMLDLTDYSWTGRKEMPGPRYEHGCTLTENVGGILIAGGYVGHADINTAFIYDILNDTWHKVADLPADMATYNPTMFLFNNSPILLEFGSSRIWQLNSTDGSWQLLAATMGAEMDGRFDTFSLVPTNMFKCS